MDCQSSLELEQNANVFQRDAPTEWAESNAIDSSAHFQPAPPLNSSSIELDLNQQLEKTFIQTLSTSTSIQEALSNLAQILGEAIKVDACLVVAEGQGPVVNRRSLWVSDPQQLSAALQVCHGLNHAVIQSVLSRDEPLAVADWPTWTHSSADVHLTVQPGLNAVLLVRTLFQGHANGIVMLMRSQSNEWQETDIPLLKSCLPTVAIAISQFQLERQVQQQRRCQSLITQITTAIRHTWEPDQIFDIAAEGTALALQAARGMILLLKYTDPFHRNRSDQKLPQAHVTMVTDWVEASLALPSQSENGPIDRSSWVLDCGLCQQLLQQSLSGNWQPIVLAERSVSTTWLSGNSPITTLPKTDDIASWGEVAAFFHLHSLPSLLAVPLENQGTLLGYLVLQEPQPRSWTTEELAFVQLVAAQVSTAIIQTRTLQQIQAVVQKRTAQLQRSLDVQAKLYEKTRQQVKQLRQLHEEREEFLSTVSHELRTPLTSMMLAIRMLRQADLSVDRRDRYLGILEQQCLQETQLINDLLALRKLETSSVSVQLQKLDIRYLIRDTAQSIEESLMQRNLRLILDLPSQPLIVYTEPDSLNRIITELLTNACKYSVPQSEVSVSILHEANPPTHQISLLVQNTGAGILPEELPYIFDKFRRCQGVTQQAVQGTGLGLALVKGLVQHLGGTIAASSQPMDGDRALWQTRFTVALPQYPDNLMQTFA